MSQPHHHVFNALQQSIIKGVDIQAILPHLVRRGIIPKADQGRYESRRSGMKILIGYLRNRTFEDFLVFVECIFLTQQQEPSKSKAPTVIASIIRAVQDYDQRMGKNFAEKVIAIQSSFFSSEAAPSAAAAPSSSVAAIEAVPSEKMSQMSLTLKQSSDALPSGLIYVGEPAICTFYSEGGVLDMPRYGFSIFVPKDAVPVDHPVIVKAAICVCGPFSISERYRVASDFVVILADGEFKQPVKIQMEHCMLMPEYRKTSEVVILRADHLSVTDDGLFTFDEFVNPEVSSSHSTLSFELQSFCVLCGAIKVGKLRMASNPSIDDDNLSSATSSFEESSEYVESSPNKSSPSSQEVTGHDLSSDDTATPEARKKVVLGKRKSALHRKLPEHQKIQRTCQPEYCALFCEPLKPTITIHSKFYKFIVFITLNCPGNVQLCKERAQSILETAVRIRIIPIEFFNESKTLIMEVENTNSNWMIEPDKTPTVSLAEVQFHMMNAKDLAQRIAQETCPPRIVYDADYTEDGIARLSCKVRIRGATSIASTDHSVFFTINVRPPALESSPSWQHAALLRQKGIDLSGGLNRQQSNSFDSASVSSWVPQSPSSLSCSYSPSMEHRPPNYERTMSGGSQNSSIITVSNVGQVNIYMSDSETEVDGTVLPPLEEYKKKLDEDALRIVLLHDDVKLMVSKHCKHWKKMALHALKLDEASIYQIFYDHSRYGAKECSAKAYEEWRQRQCQQSFGVSIQVALEMFYEAKEDQIINAFIEKGKQLGGQNIQ